MIFTKRTTKKYILFSIILCFLFVLVVFLPFIKVVSVEYEDSGKMLAYFPLNNQQKFEILYTHSVHLTPVLESYQINENNQIVQTDLVYENFAIGMPSNAHGEEIFVVEENGNYHIKNMNRVFSYIDLQVGQVVSNHQLILDGVKIPFKSFVEPGTWIRIEVEKKALWQLMKGVKIDEHEHT